MNYLEIVQQASGEMGLAVPTQVAGNNAQDVIQLGRLATGLGQVLARDFDWQALETEYRFTTEVYSSACVTTAGSAIVTGIASTATLVAADWMVQGVGVPQDTYIASVDSATQVTLTQAVSDTGTPTLAFCKTRYSMPADLKRITPCTQWDKTAHWYMIGPMNAEEWQALKSGYIAQGPRRRFRVMGRKFQIWPPSETALYLGFEYVSKNWVFDAADAGKATFTADTDTCVFDDRLMVAGLKLVYFSVKGFDTTAFSSEFNRLYESESGSDKPPDMLSLAPRRGLRLIDSSNLPDTGYGA